MYTFKKEERLCNKKLIDQLFHSGSSFLCYPFKASWLVVEDAVQSVPAQLLISVSKRRYKHAVDRNLVKRRLREVYRLNKQQHLYDLLIGSNKKIIISIGYVGKQIESFELFDKKMLKLFKQLSEELAK
ncbi:ribonuclease P protein component [Mucilaginibacter sp.]